MARAERRFARVYYDDVQRDYPAVWADDVAFATWVRLLAGAEASWPSPAVLPRSARKAVLGRLAGLIEVRGDHYVVKGLDAERIARQAAGRRGADARWHAVGDAIAAPGADTDGSPSAHANASADAMPSPDQTSPERDSPRPPSRAGGRSRANGTSPRQVAKAEADARRSQDRARKQRADQRLVAYSLGRITEATLREMNGRDAPLDEIQEHPIPANGAGLALVARR